MEVIDKRGKQQKHLAQVQADLDENARRAIIHKTLAEGKSVKHIVETDDNTRYPDEKPKRNYGTA